MSGLRVDPISEFQDRIQAQGVEIAWPNLMPR
jgi:hypothetical protein